MNRWLNKFDAWIFESYPVSGEVLGIFRILYATWMLLFIGVIDYSSKFGAIPAGGFNPPPGIARLFGGIPAPLTGQVFEVIILLILLCILVGFRTKLMSILLVFPVIIMNGFVFSTGKIDHNLLVWLTPFFMAFSNWGKHYSMDAGISANKKTTTWPITFMSILLGFGFMTAGLIKLAGGWLSTESSMVRAYFLRNYFKYDKSGWMTDFFLHLEFRLFWEFLDYFTIIWEIGFFLVIFWPVLFRLFVMVAILFHMMVFLMMNISFTHYLILYLAFFLPFLNFTSFRNWLDRKSNLNALFIGLIVLTIVSSVIMGKRSFISFLLASVFGEGVTNAVILVVANIVMVWLAVRYVIKRAKG